MSPTSVVSTVISILLLCCLTSAAPSPADTPSTISSRTSPFPQGHISLPYLPLNGTANSDLPFQLFCYDSHRSRPRINYQQCKPLLYEISYSPDYLEPKPYTSRNPVLWKEQPCLVSIWKGPKDVTVNNQYIAGMVAWVLNECTLNRRLRDGYAGYGGEIKIENDMDIIVEGKQS